MSEDHAKPFLDMAQRISRNAAEFGGALLIVSPDGTVVDIAYIGSKPDLPFFWGTIKGRVQSEADEAIAKLNPQVLYGRR